MTNPHFIQIPNVTNLRTLAGYESADGRHIKANKLLRSGALNRLTPTDAEKLANNYGVSAVIDFRMNQEVSLNPDVLPENTMYYQLPVLPFTDHATFTQRFKRRFARPESSTVHMYKKMLTDSHANEAYRGMFDLLLNNTGKNQTLLIHCTAGKDRTGVGAMLIEGALGIPDETIRTDYLLSNEALDTSLSQSDDDGNKVKALRLQPANEDNVRAIFQVVHDEYGSWPEYLRTQLGLPAEDLVTLQQIYLGA